MPSSASWLYRITYNACIDHLRKRAVTPEPMEDEALEAGFRSHPQIAAPRFGRTRPSRPNEGFSWSGSSGPSTPSPLRRRRSFSCATTRTWPSRTSPRALGLSVGSVKSYLFRAVRKLRKELVPGRTDAGLEVSHE